MRSAHNRTLRRVAIYLAHCVETPADTIGAVVSVIASGDERAIAGMADDIIDIMLRAPSNDVGDIMATRAIVAMHARETGNADLEERASVVFRRRMAAR